MKDNTYIVIQSFMRSELNLKGNALLVYALVYGFSQDGEGWFTGSKAYVADWLGITQQSVINTFKALVADGLLERRERNVNGVVFAEYKAIEILPPVKNFEGEGVKNFAIGGKKILPNNIINNTNKYNYPSVEEVRAYCDAHGYKIDAEYFVAYYTEGNNGVWRFKDGKPVKNWKQCVVTWSHRSSSSMPKSVRGAENFKRNADGGVAI